MEALVRSRGLMDKASVFGTEDCRFESYRGQFFAGFVHDRDELLEAQKVQHPRIELGTFRVLGGRHNH